MPLSFTSDTFEQSINIEEKLKSEDIQLWDILLFHAYNYLFQKDEHQISINQLLHLWNQKGGNKSEEQLKASLVRLGTKVTYQMLRQNKKVNGFFVLLSWVYVKNGFCRYAYSTRFKQLIHYPKIARYLNNNGITCAQKLLYPPENSLLDIPIESLNYYTKVLLRSYSLIS